MDLYDDILDDENKKGKWSNSAIHLLKDHLQTKKTFQSRARPRQGNMVYGSRAKPSNLIDEVPPPPVVSKSIRSSGSLLGGDWNINQEYDPLWPNDYELIMKERKAMKDKESNNNNNNRMNNERKKSNSIASSFAIKPLVDAYSDDEEETESKSSLRSQNKGATIAPPPSLMESNDEPNIASSMGVSAVAAKIMARMGYKDGQGLGKDEQGMSRALEVQKTSQRGGKIISCDMMDLERESSNEEEIDQQNESPEIEPSNNEASKVESITEIMKNPTKVVLLRNMVIRGEIDDDLEPEVKEECSKYGEVIKCIILETNSIAPEDSVRIFIEFNRVESAIKAVVDLNGRYFGGRVVRGTFYDVDKYKKSQLND